MKRLFITMYFAYTVNASVLNVFGMMEKSISRTGLAGHNSHIIKTKQIL